MDITTPAAAQEAVGTRVAFSRAWLRSVGDYSYATASLRGVITDVTHLGSLDIATVVWDAIDARVPGGAHINIANLVSEDRIHLEPR